MRITGYIGRLNVKCTHYFLKCFLYTYAVGSYNKEAVNFTGDSATHVECLLEAFGIYLSCIGI